MWPDDYRYVLLHSVRRHRPPAVAAGVQRQGSDLMAPQPGAAIQPPHHRETSKLPPEISCMTARRAIVKDSARRRQRIGGCVPSQRPGRSSCL